MIIFIFGNEDLKNDSLPLRILPKLQEKFPQIQFEVKDPNEEWEISSDITRKIPRDLIVLDTVMGIKEVKVFDDLEKFAKVPNVGMHDFDALTNLRYLQKLGKIKNIKIIGVSMDMKEPETIQKISKILEKI